MKRKSFIIALTTILMTLLAMAGCTSTTTAPPAITYTTATPPPWNISVEDANTLITDNRGNPDFVILDVRIPEEYAAGHIENAVNIDYEAADFRDRVNKLDKGRTYLVYCRTGARSAAASDIMVSLGFTDVNNMTGGITDWQATSYPVVP
jgi:phage shock protein E